MRKKVFLLASIFLLLAGLALTGPAAAKPPEVIAFASHTTGTGGYRLLGLVAEAIIEKTGIKVRLVPAGADVARALMAYKGQAHTAALNNISGWQIQEGLFEFAALEWGPTPVRNLWSPEHVGAAMAVKGDSNIYKIEDLKGKKVATMPGSPSPQLMNEAFLAFGGLTWKDVITAPFSGPAAAYDGVIKGRIDSSFFNIGGGKAYELASMPGGIRYLQMPPDNKEGWKRVQTVCPPMTPKKCTVGANISEKNPIYASTQGYPCFITWDKLDEDIAYYITKYLHETYPIYAKKNKSLSLDWTIEKSLRLFDNGVVPLHKGAVRYLREIGRWTDEREKKNEERIAHQAKLKELWDATVKEAKQKGIQDKQFPDFWMGKRAEAGFWTPKK